MNRFRFFRNGSLLESHSLYLIVVLGITFFPGCTKQSEETPALSGPAARGKTVFQTYCTTCHNSNPKRAGSIGPEVWGSSRELLETRILKAAYPPGYTPKRNTHTMPAFPHLKSDIDALHAFLNTGPAGN